MIWLLVTLAGLACTLIPIAVLALVVVLIMKAKK
jgi:hypothetical protein